MPLSVKDWKDDPNHTTPISAAALEDLETRIGSYADDQDVATLTAALAADNGPLTISTQTGDYTLALGDAQTRVEVNAATAKTVTVPPNASVAFSTGTVIEVAQTGAGSVTIAPGAGVSFVAPFGLTTGYQGSSVRLVKSGTNSWYVENGGQANAVFGTGDNVQLYNTTTAQLVDVRQGTSGTPDTSLNPILKVSRTQSVADAAVTGDGSDQLAAIVGNCVGVTATEVQSVGVFGSAKNSSNYASPGNDACGIYGVGDITAGDGTGIGGFFNGRRDVNTGTTTGVEVAADNETATAGSYNAAGASDTKGIWITAVGSSDSGAGIHFGRPTSRQQFKVGIGFGSQNSGPVADSSIRDDGTAATSLDIRGTHATGAIIVRAGAGDVIVGGSASVDASAILEVQGPDATTDPLALFGSTTNTRDYTVRLRNAVGQSRWAIVGGAGDFLTGTAAGDTVWGATTSGKAAHIGGTTKVVTVTLANTLGFHAATPIAKPSITGSRAGNAALASLLTELANYGLVTDSSTA